MRVRVFKSGAMDFIKGGFSGIVLTLPLAAVILFGLWQLDVSGRADGRRLLETSVNNAVVRHYALEGSYPTSISVVEERYGVYIDRTRYAVIYRIHAPNIMPEITVIETRRSAP